MRAKALYLHTSNRIEQLAQRLMEVSREQPLPGLLSQETVMTLNPGMARWLRFEIARSTGISFGWDFPFPATLIQRILSGFEPTADSRNLFNEPKAQWELFDLLGELESSPRFAIVKRYCEPSSSRRLQLASKLAWLFDQYLLYRPDTLLEWESGRETNDWQAEIWRRLLPRLGTGERKPKHIARIGKALQQNGIDTSRANQDLWPDRIFVFGASALPPIYIDILDTFSQFKPIHIFLLQPTDLYWADLRSPKQIARVTARNTDLDSIGSSAHELESFDIGNPLLPSFGKQSQAFLDLILDKDPTHDDSAFQEPDPSTQLGCLQSDMFLLENRSPGNSTQYAFPKFDGTIQVHDCSSPRREIETLWDYLVDYFAKHSDSQASDILVMAPDIQDYAGHIDAVFSAETSAGERIPYSIADQASPNQSAFLSGLIEYLESVKWRATANEVIALLKLPITQTAFRFTDAELDRIVFWIRDSGVVWGWDANHRESFNAFSTQRNTWREFKARLSAGIAFRNSSTLIPGNLSPYCEVEGESAETAGKLLEFLSFIEALKDDRSRMDTVSSWSQAVGSIADRIKPKDDNELRHYHAALELIQEQLPDTSGTIASGLDAFSVIANALRNTSSATGYLSGRVTFCSLKPMRSIPAKVICLIGLNDAQFPRKIVRAPFDLLAKQPRRGDRNTRDEDKQFFLETLLAARQQIYFSYQGSSAVNDTEQEPSVALAELIDYLKTAQPETIDSQLLTRHKRQSYDPEYFANDRLFTYSNERARLSQAYAEGRHKGKTTVASTEVFEQAPESPTEPVSIESLIRFFKDPQAYFVRNALEARFTEFEDSLPDDDLIEHHSLARYALRDQFADAICSGRPIDSIDQELLASFKLLPPGYSERIAFDSLREKALTIESRWNAESIARPLEEMLIDRSIGAYQLTGRIRKNGTDTRPHFLHPGKWNARIRIAHWIQHLAMNLNAPTQSCIESLSESDASLSLAPVANASNILADLLDIYRDSLHRPIPFLPQLSWDAWEKRNSPRSRSRTDDPIADHIAISQSLLESNQRAFSGRPTYPWSPSHQACFGLTPPVDASYAELSIIIWSPYVESLKTEGDAT